MNPLRMSVCLESLGLPLRQGLQEIERLGVTGVQVNAVGEISRPGRSRRRAGGWSVICSGSPIWS